MKIIKTFATKDQDPTKCSDAVVVAIELKTGLKFKASTSLDVVQGAVSIEHDHANNTCVALIEIYEQNDGRRQKPLTLPKANDITSVI